jgi:hypothetical protein
VAFPGILKMTDRYDIVTRTVFIILMIPVLFLFSGCNPTQTELESMEIPMPTSSRSLSNNSPDWWHPVPGSTWQWHLSDPPVDIGVEAQVFDIDLFDNDASVIRNLHRQGRKVICYISVGSWEDWRPDAGEFPNEVLGNDYEGWPGEKWLDIRRIDLLAPIMRARLDLCKARGFDGVEPDNIEIHDNDTGFPLTCADQLAYARWLAEEAHARGLAIGIKNAPDMVVDSVSFFDFAITEDAFYYDWIGEMLPFIEAGKPIFAAEYTDMDVDFHAACAWGKQNNVSFILKNRILTAYRLTCP